MEAKLEKGIEAFKTYFIENVTNKFVPPSKSTQKYLDYLHSDGWTFHEYLGIELPDICQERKGWIYRSTKYRGVEGKHCKTKELARKSYKEALKLFREDQKQMNIFKSECV